MLLDCCKERKVLMIKEIKKFVANDGSEWVDVDKATQREALLKQIDELLKPLGDVPQNDGCRFANGEGYIQQDKFIVAQIKLDLIKLTAKELNDPSWLESKVNFMNLGRWLDDSGNPLYSAWGRLINIDDHGREWGQAYYALNPDKATFIKIR